MRVHTFQFIVCVWIVVFLVALVSLTKYDSSSSSLVHNKVLIVNIIGDSVGDVEEALANALAFVRPLSSHCNENITCRVFLPAVISSLSNSSQVDELKSTVKTNTITYPPTIVSHNIGSSSDSLAEHVSEILFALATVAEDYRSIDNEPVAVSLSFSALSFPKFSDLRFLDLYRRVSYSNPHRKKVLLLEKNRDLTSPSDWHDLQVVVMALATVVCHNWLSVLRKVFLFHADRPAFTLREPRAAVMESMWGPVMRKGVGFLSEHDVCLDLQADKHHGRTYRQPLCGQGPSLRTSTISISCKCTSSIERIRLKALNCPCSTLFSPRDWVRQLVPPSANINYRVDNAEHFLDSLPEGDKIGVARFRFTNDSDMPQGFCWDTGYVHYFSRSACGLCSLMLLICIVHYSISDTVIERTSQSRIFSDINISTPFIQSSKNRLSEMRVVIISGSSRSSLDRALDMTLSKIYYSHRHGYAIEHLVSEAYANYFGDTYLDVSDISSTGHVH